MSIIISEILKSRQKKVDSSCCHAVDTRRVQSLTEIFLFPHFLPFLHFLSFVSIIFSFSFKGATASYESRNTEWFYQSFHKKYKLDRIILKGLNSPLQSLASQVKKS